MQNVRFQSQVITSVHEWRALESDWNALFQAAVNPSVVLSFAWLDTWWQTFGERYGKSPGGLRILTVKDGTALIAALPLYLQCHRRAGLMPSRKLLFIGTGEAANEAVYPEKLDLLRSSLTPEQEHFVASSVSELFQRAGWDEFDSGVMHSGALVYPLLPPRSASCISLKKEYPGPWANLSEGFDRYLEKRSSNSRQQFRRFMRDAEKQNVKLTLAETKEDRLRYLEELMALHQARWQREGQPGAFRGDLVRQFHRSLVASLSPETIILARLGDDRPEALLYGFLSKGVYDFFQSGVCEPDAARLKSPGLTAHLLLMQELSRRGAVRYDLLAGSSAYKEKLATDDTPFVRCRLLKLTLGNALGVVDEVRHKVIGRLSRKSQPLPEGLQHDA